MASQTRRRTSWVPWWLDPYSDNFVAFGVLFSLLMLLIVGGLWLLRILVVGPNAGAHPVTPPSSPSFPQVLLSIATSLL